jgi:hypothetical protein
MATYKGIQGYTVQKLSSDPPAEQSVGQLWYNSGTGAFKVGTEGAGSWAAGTAMNNVRAECAYARAGTLTAGLAIAGDAPGAGYLNICEEFDGSAWTERADLNTPRSGTGGLGTATAAMCISGNTTDDSNKCESYNGTTWTETGDIATKSQNIFGAGTTTAGLSASGSAGAAAQTFDGSTWTLINSVNSPRAAGGSVGLETTALIYSGGPPGVTTELYNGSTWSEQNDVNAARQQIGSGFGSPTAAMLAGGNTPGDSRMTECEIYDGTCWSETGDLSTGVRMGAGGGTTSSGFNAGGHPASAPPAETNACEIWTNPIYTIKTVTVS